MMVIRLVLTVMVIPTTAITLIGVPAGTSSPDFVHGYLAWYTCIVGDTGIVSNNDVDDVYYNSCGALRRPIATTSMRVMWSQMAASAAVMWIGIPAGILSAHPQRIW